MAIYNDVSTLNAMFYRSYGDVEDQLSDVSIFKGDVPFNPDRTKPLGELYQFAVLPDMEHGVTFDSTGTAFDLAPAIAANLYAAQVRATSLIIRTRIAYTALSRGSSSQQAFEDVFDQITMNMRRSMDYYLELSLLYGQSSLAGAFSAAATTSSTTGTLTVSVSQWATGIWQKAKNGLFDLSKGVGDVSETARVKVTAVDIANRKLTVQLSSGSITTIRDAAASGFVLTLPGQGAASAWGVFAGLERTLTNTTTIYSLNAATVGNFNANVVSFGGAQATMAKLTQACIPIANQASPDMLRAYIPTAAWADLNNDGAALRRFVENTKSEIELGTQRLKYYGPAGSIEIVAHPMVKSGRMFIVDPSALKRVGSSDISFTTPGTPPGGEPNFFQYVPNVAGVELQCWWDQALVSERMNTHAYVNNLVNRYQG